MGKGGYTGGSTIIGPWSGGWFSSGRQAQPDPNAPKKAKKAKPKKAKKPEKTPAQKAADAEWARKMTIAHQNRRKGDPMKGVQVVRYTARTLRLPKPKD